MDFSKLKLNEAALGSYTGLGTAQKARQGASQSGQTQKSPDRKNMQSAMSTSLMGNKVRDTAVSMQKTTEQYMTDLRKEVEEVKLYESQKSDWRTELNEKVIDGQEREDHPYVTVMPTGDENLIQAIKQMRGEVKDKKQELKAGVEEEYTPEKMANREAAGKKYADKFKPGSKNKAIFPKSLPTMKAEEVEELDEAKKKCKDGYKYDSKKKKCVKKKKSSSKKSTTVIVGRPIYGGGHHHHHGGSGGDNGGDNGTDENNSGGGEGGVSEMFDYLADALVTEMMDGKSRMEKMKAEYDSALKQPSPFDGMNDKQKKQMTKATKSTRNIK